MIQILRTLYVTEADRISAVAADICLSHKSQFSVGRIVKVMSIRTSNHLEI